MRERNKIFGNSTLCWCCQNAVADCHGSCRWSRVLWPVDGWEVVDGVNEEDALIVKQCPEFKADKCVKELAHKCIDYALKKPVFVGEMLVDRFVNGMNKLDYDPMYEKSYIYILNKYMPKDFDLECVL